jgi:hypothetical protein
VDNVWGRITLELPTTLTTEGITVKHTEDVRNRSMTTACPMKDSTVVGVVRVTIRRETFPGRPHGTLHTMCVTPRVPSWCGSKGGDGAWIIPPLPYA